MIRFAGIHLRAGSAALVGLCWLLAAAAPVAAAEVPLRSGEVPLRSGEHRTFSRLVFADRPDRSWEIVRPAPGRVRIEFSPGVPDLDADGVFDLIPRDRIRDVRTNGRGLDLTLGCDCPVEVFQIPTGHVVIDVRDGGPLPASRSVEASPPRLRLPVVFPLADLPFRLPGAARLVEPSAVRDYADAMPPGPRQVRLHPSGVVPLIRTRTQDVPDGLDVAACAIEPVAREAFLADPVLSADRIAERTVELLDGEDRWDVFAVRELAETYLAAGWGAEAAQIVATIPSDDGTVAIVAAAIDGDDVPAGAGIDPGCGPATATVALLDPAGTERWDRVDPVELRRFLDRLDPVTLALLRPRLQDRLERLDDGDLLAGLGPAPSPDPEPASSPERLAAGTDMTAIRAAAAILERANATGQPSDEAQLVNAMALLPSVPAGEARSALERALAVALVLSRRPAEAMAMVADGRVEAEKLLAVALDALPAGQSAEFAVRLRPYLSPGSPVARRAADLFQEFHLAATARAFLPDAEDRLPVEIRPDGAMADPWLSRDLRAMGDVDPADGTVRNRLAAEILARNASPPPPTDLAAAGAVLDRSRAVSGLLATLLAPGAVEVTPR